MQRARTQARARPLTSRLPSSHHSSHHSSPLPSPLATHATPGPTRACTAAVPPYNSGANSSNCKPELKTGECTLECRKCHAFEVGRSLVKKSGDAGIVQVGYRKTRHSSAGCPLNDKYRATTLSRDNLPASGEKKPILGNDFWLHMG